MRALKLVHAPAISPGFGGAWTRLTASTGIADASASTHPVSTVSHAQSLADSRAKFRSRVLTPAHEVEHGGVRLAGPLELRHVPAVELEMARRRQGPLHVLHERDRDERVVAAPDEQGVR